MSLIHLEKSVLTFHARELFEDGCAGSGLPLLGLGIMLFGGRLLPSLANASRPVAKQLVKSQLAKSQPAERHQADRAPTFRPNVTLSEWVRQQQAQPEAGSARPHGDRAAA
ncbi:MAG: hypothetical protein ACFB9N_01745 [Geitlerinemataceae cyanobacterium]